MQALLAGAADQVRPVELGDAGHAALPAVDGHVAHVAVAADEGQVHLVVGRLRHGEARAPEGHGLDARRVPLARHQARDGRRRRERRQL